MRWQSNKADFVRVKRYAAALRRAAEVVAVPGTPLTLRLDEVHESASAVTVRWSFVDPEVHEGRPRGRLRGTATFAVSGGRRQVDTLARAWWEEVQLAAGHRFKRQVDADFIPGAAPRQDPWTVEEAWAALLRHLQSSEPGMLEETDEGIRVVWRVEETHYRFSRQDWADYLNSVDLASSGPPADEASSVVPAATGPLGELPIWAADELAETVGADGPVVTIVRGRLVGSGER